MFSPFSPIPRDTANATGQIGDSCVVFMVRPSLPVYVSHDALTHPTDFPLCIVGQCHFSLRPIRGCFACIFRKLLHFSVPPLSHGAALILPSEMNDLCLCRAYFFLLPHWFVRGSQTCSHGEGGSHAGHIYPAYSMLSWSGSTAQGVVDVYMVRASMFRRVSASADPRI